MEEKNLQDLLADAKAGDLEAQFALGMRCRSGKAQTFKRKAAAKWWQAAAEQGKAEAMTHLGMAHILGMGVANDEELGVKWWQLAADRGYAQAQLLLARYYLREESTQEEKEAALQLLKLAAEQGNESACLLVGQMYYNGIGVEQDYAEALKWFDGSAYWVGKCYLHGHGVAQNVEKATELWESVAKGSYTMYMRLAHLYSDGVHMEPNHKKAAHWWREACTGKKDHPTKGVPEAMYKMGCSYYKGRGLRKDHLMALHCFKWAIKSYERYEKICVLGPEDRQMYFDAHRMVLTLGSKSVVRKLRVRAWNGDVEAKEILEETGIGEGKLFFRKLFAKIKTALTVPEKKQPVPVAEGDTLWHETWGEGTVIQVEGVFFWVEFPEVGKKSFLNPDDFDTGALSKEPM